MNVIKREKYEPVFTQAPIEQLLDESLDHFAYKNILVQTPETYREVEYNIPRTGINLNLKIENQRESDPSKKFTAKLCYVPALDCKEDVTLVQEKLEKILSIA